MNNADFWASVSNIISEGFTPEGLKKLNSYAEQFISGKLVYQRFSPYEQYGCSAGSATNVVASLLAAAKTGTNQATQCEFTDFKEELKCAAQQAQCIEHWARITGCYGRAMPASATSMRHASSSSTRAIFSWARAVACWPCSTPAPTSAW